MFQIQVPDQVRALFSVAMSTEVGDGSQTLFWEDRWLHGQRIADIAPQLYSVVDKRNRKRRTVSEALYEHLWLQDARRASAVGALGEFLELWDITWDFQLQPNVEDKHF